MVSAELPYCVEICAYETSQEWFHSVSCASFRSPKASTNNDQRANIPFTAQKKEPAVLRFDSKIGFDFYFLCFLLVLVYVVAMGNLSDFMIVFIQFFCDVG